MGKAGDWRNQCIRYSHTIGSVTPRLPQAFHRKPQAAAKADRDNHVAFASGTRQVRRFPRGRRCDGRQPEQDQMIVKKTHQIRGQISTQNDDLLCGVDFLRKRSDAVGVRGVSKSLQIVHISINSFPHMCGEARPFGFARLHDVERSGLGNGELMQVLLELTIIRKSQFHRDSHRGSRVHLKPVSELAGAQEHEGAWILEDWPKEFLPPGAEHCIGLRQVREGHPFRGRTIVVPWHCLSLLSHCFRSVKCLQRLLH